MAVAEVDDTGEYETVYNCHVAEWHTYFVGSAEWGFSVWAHNACVGLDPVKGHIEGDVRTIRVAGAGRKAKVELGKQIKKHLSGLSEDAEIVYVLRDARTGEVLSVGKTSNGPNSRNILTRVHRYGRQEEFLRKHGHADVELVMEYGVVKQSSIKHFKSLGIEVEVGIEAPLRAAYSKE